MGGQLSVWRAELYERLCGKKICRTEPEAEKCEYDRSHPKICDLPPVSYEEKMFSKVQDFWMHYDANDCPSEDIENFHVYGITQRQDFAVVTKCRYLKNDRFYSLKSLKKSSFASRTRSELPFREKMIQYASRSPFTARLFFAFKTNSHLHLVMEYAEYGDFYSSVLDGNLLTETKAKFFTAQLVLALEFLHSAHVIYRILCPQSIMLFADGYLKLSDFQGSKIVYGAANSFVGYVDYMAPEIIQRTPYKKTVDWWSLGILVYEMLMGRTPFESKHVTENTTEDNILLKPVQLFPKFDLSDDVENLILGLLEKDPADRLGSFNGAKDIKEHAWFSSLDFQTVFDKRYRTTVDLGHSIEILPVEEDDVDDPTVEEQYTELFRNF